MIKILASCLLVTIAATSVHGIRLQLPSFVFGLMKVGLDMDDTEPSTLYDQVCSNLSLWRGLKYTDNEQNVLDVATSPGTSSAPRPVLLFVAGESFANEGTSVDWEMRQKAICLSARNGMVGVSMSYRRALCKPTWGTRTSSTRSAIPSCRRIGSRTFGGSADASRPKCAPLPPAFRPVGEGMTT